MDRFPKRPALTLSATLVLAIAALSYSFTIAVAIACVYLPLELLDFLCRINQFPFQAFLLVLGGIAISGLMLWSIVPRRQRFVEPGVPLELSAHPRLRDLITDVTGQLNERIPDDVYLTAAANASVNEHGGLFGFGSKRALSLGFPLLAILSTSEFRALLAHECAHYYGGDTLLLPLERHARAAMARVLASLTSDSGLSDALRKIKIVAALHSFVALIMSIYWRGLIRVSNVISRQQEFRCDELACYLAGADATLAAFEKLERLLAVQDALWFEDVLPLLRRGVMPPIAASLSEFVANPDISAAADRAALYRLENEKINPESTHPLMRDRLARIRCLRGEPARLGDSDSALRLINDVEAHERDLVRFFFMEDMEVTQLRRVDWDLVAEEIYIPEWRSFAKRHSTLLQGVVVADVPRILDNAHSLVGLVPNPPGRLFTLEQRTETVRDVIIAASLLRLLDAGWRCVIRPGARCFVKQGEELQPWTILRQRPVDRVRWEELCTREGILDRPLYVA